MRTLRATFILGLLLALPALAIRGNMSNLWPLSRAVAVADHHGGKHSAKDPGSNDVDDGRAERAIPVPGEVNPQPAPPSTHYKRSDAQPPANGASRLPPDGLSVGKRLRPAIYRPLDNGQPASIRRIPAADGEAERAGELAIAQMERELQQRGAARYRLDQQGGGYRFTCEFPPRETAGDVRVFRADAADGAEAMYDVLAQVRDWERGTMR